MAPLLRVDVVLLSGQSARIFGDPDLTVQELRQNAQQELQVKLMDLFLGHKKLDPWITLKDLLDGEVVNASVWQPKLCSSRHSDSFAFITDDGILFGDPLVAPMERLDLTDVRDVRMSADAFAALRADGSVHCWGGFFSGGYLGAMRQELYQVRQLEASQRAFGALRADGRVVTWGDVVFGGDSSEVADELVEVSCLKASRRAFAAIVGAARSVVAWGDRAFGGDCSAVQDQLVDVVQLHTTERAFAALTACGRVVTWGDAIYGGACPVALQKGKVLMIQASQRAFAAYSKELGVVSWGDPDFGGDSRFINLGHGHILEMEATAGAFAALLDTGTVLCWGHHDLGGHLSDETRELLVQQRLHRLVASNGAFVALGETDLVSWGNHFGGADPDACASLSKVEDLQGSASSFMALGSDGALITWGRGVRNGFAGHEHLSDECPELDEDLEVPNIDGVESHDVETLDSKGLKKDLTEAKSFKNAVFGTGSCSEKNT